MKPKIELNKEYLTRGGGVGVVHFVDSNRLLGRIRNPGKKRRADGSTEMDDWKRRI